MRDGDGENWDWAGSFKPIGIGKRKPKRI
jgi:hypothetical protein